MKATTTNTDRQLLDMLGGRSKRAFKTWLAEQDESWRDGVEVVAMDSRLSRAT